MLKQKKNLNFKYGTYFCRRIIGIKRFIYKTKTTVKVMRRKQKALLFNSVSANKETLNLFFLRIKVVRNNIFCYLFNGKPSVLLISGTAGLYHIKLSKKSMRFYSKNVLNKFFTSCKKILRRQKKKVLVFTVQSSARLKRNLIKAVQSFFKKQFIVIAAFNEVKCFNGCRQRKQIRRKRRFFRIFKNIA